MIGWKPIKFVYILEILSNSHNSIKNSNLTMKLNLCNLFKSFTLFRIDILCLNYVIKIFRQKFKFSASLNHFESETKYMIWKIHKHKTLEMLNKLVLNNSAIISNIGNMSVRHVSSSTASITKVHRAIYARTYP